jgi:type I restriction enzyme, S subunit
VIDGLKPYPAYKPTSVPWLQRIPTSWEVCRNGRLFAQQNETGFPDLPILEVSLKTGVRVRDFDSSKRKQVMSNKEKYKRARSGDIAYNMMRMWQGAVGVAPTDGLVSPAYVVAWPFTDTNSRYFELLFRTSAYMHEVNQTSRGIVSDRNRLYWEDFKQLPSPYPPPEDQSAIVRYLDHADRLIRRYIRAKKQLIGLLNEQKQALIQSVISKVSTPECRTMPIRAVLRPVKRLGFPSKTLLSLFRDYGVIPKASRENKNVDVRDLALCQLVNAGDVVMNKMKAWQGSIAVSNLEGIVSPDYMVLEFQIEPVVTEFFHYALRSHDMVANYRKQAYGVRPGQWRLMYPDFCRLRLPVPSVAEQQAIVEEIASQTQILNTAITSTAREIALLQEYRTRLMADVVTGKLDVREAAARLPDEIEESRPIEEPAEFKELDEDMEGDELEEAMAEVER